MKTRLNILNILVFLLAASAAFASGPPLYQWTQSGYVSIVVGSDWDDSVTPGSSFTTRMLFRSSSSQSYSPDTAEARYTDVLVSASISFGNYTFDFNVPYPDFPPCIQVLNNDVLGGPVDGYGWYWATPVSQYGIVAPFLQGFLLSTDLSLINSPDFTIQQLPVSRFNRQNCGQIDGYDSLNNYEGIVFCVTDYSVTGVPEPGNSIFFAGLLAFVAIARWPQLKCWASLNCGIKSQRRDRVSVGKRTPWAPPA